MPKKTIIGELEGERLIVENTWLSGVRLFHGEKLVGANSQTFAVNRGEPLISTYVVIGGTKRLVEVFVVASFTVKLQLKVDGRHLAGNEL